MKQKQELRTFEKKRIFQNLNNLYNPLMTVIHSARAITAEAQAQINSDFNYDSLRSRLTSHNNNKLSKNK